MFEKTKINEKGAEDGRFLETFLLTLGSGVVELVEQLLPKSDICSLNPVIGKFIFYQLFKTALKRRK